MGSYVLYQINNVDLKFKIIHFRNILHIEKYLEIFFSSVYSSNKKEDALNSYLV